MPDITDSPVRALRAEILKRKTMLKLAPFGLGHVVDLLDAYVEHVEARLSLLEGMGGAVATFAAQLSEAEVIARQRPACAACDE
jgi:hypothetical protein